MSRTSMLTLMDVYYVGEQIKKQTTPEIYNLVSRSNVSFMVWGYISIHGTCDLIVIHGNVDQFRYIDVFGRLCSPVSQYIRG